MCTINDTIAYNLNTNQRLTVQDYGEMLQFHKHASDYVNEWNSIKRQARSYLSMMTPIIHPLYSYMSYLRNEYGNLAYPLNYLGEGGTYLSEATAMPARLSNISLFAGYVCGPVGPFESEGLGLGSLTKKNAYISLVRDCRTRLMPELEQIILTCFAMIFSSLFACILALNIIRNYCSMMRRAGARARANPRTMTDADPFMVKRKPFIFIAAIITAFFVNFFLHYLMDRYFEKPIKTENEWISLLMDIFLRFSLDNEIARTLFSLAKQLVTFGIFAFLALFARSKMSEYEEDASRASKKLAIIIRHWDTHKKGQMKKLEEAGTKPAMEPEEAKPEQGIALADKRTRRTRANKHQDTTE